MTADLRLRRTIWAALAFSTLIYGLVVVLAKAPRRYPTFDAALQSPQVLVIDVMAAAAFALGIAWPLISSISVPRVQMIIILSMFEMCTLFGVIAAYLAGDRRLYLAPWALSIAGFIRAFPAAEPR